MRRSHGSIVAGVLTLLAIAGAGRLEAQVAAGEARAFLGDWNVSVEGEMPVTIRINVTEKEGRVAAAVTGAEGRTVDVQSISKKDQDLVLSYTTTLQGTDLPISITLTPDGAGLKGNLDIAGGMYTAPVKGVKR